jgi:enoyl-[acyl-carrier-protein] reductase (NADH)
MERARVAFTYQGDAQLKRLKPLAAVHRLELVVPCDVEVTRRSMPCSPR